MSTSFLVASAELGPIAVGLTLVTPDRSDVTRNADPHPPKIGAASHPFHQQVSECRVNSNYPGVSDCFSVAPAADVIEKVCKRLVVDSVIIADYFILFEEILIEARLLLSAGPEDDDLRALVHTHT